MLTNVNSILWGLITILLFFSGIFYGKKLKYIQIRVFYMIKQILSSSEKNNGISIFNTLMVALATKIGVGSIIGVAFSIYYGGPGTVFWMLISTFFISSSVLMESILGSKYKVKKGELSLGGPHYYLQYVGKNISKLYALLLFFCYTFGFIAIQMNTMVNSFKFVFDINNILVCTTIVIFFAYFVCKGSKIIIKSSLVLVPIMSLIYISLGVMVISKGNIIEIVNIVLKDAFCLKKCGIGILTSIIIGVQRGVFSSEAGIGSCAISSAISNTKKHINQGYIQTIGVYFTNIFICMSTAGLILNSNYNQMHFSSGIDLVSYAFKYHFGNMGIILLVICIFLFSFSTILTGYYYSENSINFLYKKINTKIFKLLLIAVSFIGGIINTKLIWDLTDLLIACMVVLNSYGIYKLKDEVIKEF